MKYLVLLIALVTSVDAVAASPFTISGDKIKAIFDSKVLWRKLGSAVESIVFNGHDQSTGVSKFTLSTTEMVPELDSAGRTLGYLPSACKVVVDVIMLGDPMDPEWEVESVDFSGCPATALK